MNCKLLLLILLSLGPNIGCTGDQQDKVPGKIENQREEDISIQETEDNSEGTQTTDQMMEDESIRDQQIEDQNTETDEEIEDEEGRY